jgi:PST family polysaccharide transporter
VTPPKPNPYFDDNRSGDALSAKSLRGGVFSIASRGLSVFVQVGSTVILARILSPEDFGLVSMVAAFTGFIPMLSDLGTRDAAVQRQSITEHEVSALFWLTVAIGTVLGLLLAIGSPFIAAYYHEPRLRDIALASATGFVVSAASCQHFALLRRAMQFKAIAAIEVGSNLLSSIVSIAMALYGAGYWALVAKPVLLAAFTLLGVGISCRWLPGIPSLTQGVKDMVKFGLHITGFTMADYAGRAIDRIAIGKRNGAAPLGYYQQCLFVYENVLGLVVLSLHPVAVAGLSKLTDNPAELKRSWAKAVGALAFFAMPMFGLLAVTAEDVVTLVLGDKWKYTAYLVGILSLRGIPHCIERTLGWLHVPAGRGDRWMRWGLVGTTVQVAALFCGLPFGVEGVVIAYVVSMYIVFIPAIVYAGKPLGIGATDLMKAIAAPFTGTMLLCAVGYALRLTVLANFNGVLRASIIIVTCGSLYLLITVVVLKTREPLALVWRMLRGLRNRGTVS